MPRNSLTINHVAVKTNTSTYINPNTGLESTTCGSIIWKYPSEICSSFITNSTSQYSAINNSNSFSPPSSSSSSPDNNFTANQDCMKSVNYINNQEQDKEISNLWSEAPTNNINTDSHYIDPENSIPKNPNDPFGLTAIHDYLFSNPTDNSIWKQKFNNTTILPANPLQDETFGNNLYESNTLINNIDQLPW